MLVSVIVPNYNHSSFLEQRLDSILAQTYRDLEVIILDDCSTDESLRIIEKYSTNSAVTRVIANPVNSGSPFRQWSRGIEAARGKWIWIAESDDFCEPDLLQTLLTVTAKDKEIVMAYAQSMEVDETGSRQRVFTFHTDSIDRKRWTTDYVKPGGEEIREALFYKNSIPNASAVIFRREVYQKVSLDYTALKYCGDWLLWSKLLEEGKIFFCCRVLNYFRTHKGTTRSQVSPSILREKLAEQYLVVSGMKGIPAGIMKKRLRGICLEYSHTYKLPQFLKAIFDIKSYRGPIPFLRIIGQSISMRLGRLLR